MAGSHNPSPGVALSRLDHTNPQSLFVYGLRSIGQALLAPYADHFRGLSTCGHPHPFLLPAGEAVPIYLEVIPSEEGAEEVAAYAAGIATCGSPWACPVCSPALGHRRGEALARALERLQGMGYRIAHAVLTVQHTRGDSLATLRRVLSDVWRRVVSHRQVKKLWAGVAWYRSVEVTFGRHGWHPHLHLAIAVPPGRDPWAVKALVDAWLEAVEAQGWVAVRDAQFFGVAEGAGDVVEVGKYVGKGGVLWGLPHEVAGGAVKHKAHGLTPFQLLAGAFGAWLEGDPALEGVFAFGEDHPLEVEGVPLTLREFCGRARKALEKAGISPEEAAWRWLEYVEATKGWKRTASSRSLTLLLRQVEEELSVRGEVVERIYLSQRAYRWLLLSGRIALLYHYAEVSRSLRLACELLGLVEGVEWFTPPANAPPPEGGLATQAR
jgi:hypothetical protein